MKDRYLPGRFGAAYAAGLPDSELIELPEAGHWPWIDDPRGRRPGDPVARAAAKSSGSA